MKVSVIIPTKDRYDELFRAVDSVLRQSFQNIEVVIVQDKIDDDKKAILIKKYGSKIKFIQIPHTGKVGEVRNHGLLHSTGDFVAFLDDDDWWDDKKISAQIKYIESDNYTGSVVSAIKLEDRSLGAKYLRPTLKQETIYTSKDLLSELGYPHISTIILPRTLALRYKFNNKLVQLEDLDFMIKTTNDKGLLVCDDILCFGCKDINNGLSSRGHATDALKVYNDNENILSVRQRVYFLSYILAPRCSYDRKHKILLNKLPSILYAYEGGHYKYVLRYIFHLLVPHKVSATLRKILVFIENANTKKCR